MLCNRNQYGVVDQLYIQSKFRKRDQICSYQRWWGEEELDEGSQKIQTSSYKINKY